MHDREICSSMKEPRVVARKFLASLSMKALELFELKCFDPFLLLDEFSVSTLASFPDYPHRDDDEECEGEDKEEEEEEEEGENEVVPWS
ncbi:hypothetical protein K1719_030758 [Acacia pycnantha]|nr:hypothetical protein K1719_030758 [Acacia pycnantha]